MSNTSFVEDFSYVFNIMEGTRKEVDRVVAERNFALLVNEVVQILAEENKSLRTENDILRERLNLAAISDYRISEKHRRVLLSQGLAENQLRMPALIEMVAQYASRFVQPKSKHLKQNERPMPEQAPPAPSGIPIAPQQRQILASFIERYSNPMIETTSTTSILTAAQVNHAAQVSRPAGIDQLSKTNDQFERVRQSTTSCLPRTKIEYENDVNSNLCSKPLPTAEIRLQPSRNSRQPEISCADDLHPELLPATDIRSRPSRNRREAEIERAADVNRDFYPAESLPVADICLRQSRNSRQPEINRVNDERRDLRSEPLPVADIRSRHNRNSRQPGINCVDDNRDLRPEPLPVADIRSRQNRSSRQPEINCVDDNRDLRPEPLPVADIRPFKSVPVNENRLPKTSLEHTGNGYGNALLHRQSRSSRSPTWKASRSQTLQWESDSEERNYPIKRIRHNPARCEGRIDKCEYPPYQRLGHHTEDYKLRKRYEPPSV